jgi:fluoroquinolone resistance protein
MNKTIFKKCTISDCDFINTEIKNGDFSSSDLKDSLFHNVNLQGASFEQAINYNINPENNNIKKAVFSLPEAINLLSHLDIRLK